MIRVTFIYEGQGCRSKNGQKLLFPQCWASIGNNSGSIKHRATKVACTMGFQLWQIEWCDRHLCQVTKCMHSRVVVLRLAISCCVSCSVDIMNYTQWLSVLWLLHESAMLCQPLLEQLLSCIMFEFQVKTQVFRASFDDDRTWWHHL